MPAVDYDKLAYYYDSLVTDQSDLGFFRDLARRANGPVAEFMAGSGRVSVPIAEDGIDITCIDSSKEMLEILRDKLRAKGACAKSICGDITQVDLGMQFALIFIAFHSFEELVSDSERRDCLANVLRHLRKDGRFVCTTHDVPTRLETIGCGTVGRWDFIDVRTQRRMILSVQTTYDDDSGIVSGEETLS
ncbi:MAG TPA: class I SAM-dependent methyltransferase, partial [Pirellulaceae bacterium]|nr:class I SAM-dependent methyltransferase [Pirellulaceae bacterium]